MSGNGTKDQDNVVSVSDTKVKFSSDGTKMTITGKASGNSLTTKEGQNPTWELPVPKAGEAIHFGANHLPSKRVLVLTDKNGELFGYDVKEDKFWDKNQVINEIFKPSLEDRARWAEYDSIQSKSAPTSNNPAAQFWGAMQIRMPSKFGLAHGPKHPTDTLENLVKYSEHTGVTKDAQKKILDRVQNPPQSNSQREEAAREEASRLRMKIEEFKKAQAPQQTSIQAPMKIDNLAELEKNRKAALDAIHEAKKAASSIDLIQALSMAEKYIVPITDLQKMSPDQQNRNSENLQKALEKLKPYPELTTLSLKCKIVANDDTLFNLKNSSIDSYTKIIGEKFNQLPGLLQSKNGFEALTLINDLNNLIKAYNKANPSQPSGHQAALSKAVESLSSADIPGFKPQQRQPGQTDASYVKAVLDSNLNTFRNQRRVDVQSSETIRSPTQKASTPQKPSQINFT